VFLFFWDNSLLRPRRYWQADKVREYPFQTHAIYQFIEKQIELIYVEVQG